MTASIERHNTMIQRANARLSQLWEAGVRADGRLGAQGVTITIERPSWQGVTVSSEIIPY